MKLREITIKEDGGHILFDMVVEMFEDARPCFKQIKGYSYRSTDEDDSPSFSPDAKIYFNEVQDLQWAGTWTIDEINHGGERSLQDNEILYRGVFTVKTLLEIDTDGIISNDIGCEINHKV